jgi:hypothetical protein
MQVNYILVRLTHCMEFHEGSFSIRIKIQYMHFFKSKFVKHPNKKIGNDTVIIYFITNYSKNFINRVRKISPKILA